MLKKTHRLRLLLLAMMSLAVFGVIIFRLYVVQIEQHRQFHIRAEHQQNKSIELIPRRGDILDRNGLKLATSYVSNTIYIDTRRFKRPGAPEKATAETSDSLMTTDTTDSALVRSIKEKLAKQKEEEAAKDKVKAAKLWEKKNKNKRKAWDELGVDPQLIDELAAALSIPADTQEDTAELDAAMGLEARRMPMDVAREAVQNMFANPRRHLFYRKAPDSLAQRMADLEARFALPDGFIILEKHSKRFYPNGSLASHLLGFTSIDGSGDNVGIAGIEQEYNEQLKGRYAKQKIQINSGQRGLAPLDEGVIESTYGNDVVLTIDQQLQMYAERALRMQVGHYQAKGGIALVMDVRTGGILAMASCPDYDVNQFKKADASLQLKNRILTDPIEIGSVMKIITATLLIDKGLLNPEEVIDCSSPKVFGTRVVRDVHSVGVVPFRTAFAESSNVGLVTVGLRLEPNTYYEGLTRFGLGQRSQIDLPGEGNGVLRPVSQWSSLSRSSLPMGYETSLTPLQVISALGAIANDGMRLRPHLLKEVRAPGGRVVESAAPRTAERVASVETCQTIRDLMEGVVLEGTGKGAVIPGYRVGGKTGTTVKYNARPTDDDKRRYYSSFAGLLPIDNPRIAVYCYVDEPQGAKYGGTVAAPIFREIAMAAVHVLNIPPNDPVAYAQAKDKGVLPLDEVTSASVPTSATLLIASGAHAKSEAETVNAAALLRENPDGPMLPGLTEPDAKDTNTSASWGSVFAADPKAKPAPDLHGLTLAATYEKLAELGLEGDLTGAGVAVAQQPAPGAPLRAGEKIRVAFMHASQRTPVPDRVTASLAPDKPASVAAGSTDEVALPGEPQHFTLQPKGGGLKNRDTEADVEDNDVLPVPEESAGEDEANRSE